jgi:MFS family permease
MSASAPVGATGRRLPRPHTFAAIAAILVLFMAASSAPTPLYVVYQQSWGFSETTLTIVFAVYVFGLLASLLVLGALSDHVGRRPVLIAAIALESVSLVLFLLAGGVPALLLARALQGIATGAAVTTLGAALVDNDPPHARGRAGVVSGAATIGGLAVGAVGCGALAEFAPAPTHTVYLLLLAGMVLAALVVAVLPETSARRSGGLASLKPRVGIPPRLRLDMLGIVPLLLASWALGGLYLSLGPSVAVRIFNLHNHLVGGLVVTLLCGTGALTAVLLRGWPIGRTVGLASVLLALGTAVALVGVQTGTALVAGIGTVVAGVGFGAAALGCFGTIARIAAPAERAEVFAVTYVIAYLAFSVPAVLAGFASTTVGLRLTADVYGIAVVALGIAALIARRLIDGRQRAAAATAAA